jgi:hypothetical protein
MEFFCFGDVFAAVSMYVVDMTAKTKTNNGFTDGGKFVSPTHRLRSTPQKHYFSNSDTHLC